MTQSQNPTSPSWGTNTKLVVALTIVVIVGALLVKFQFIITPLLIALLLAYLFYPIASFLQRKLHFSWNASVAVIYLVVLVILLGLLTAGGVGLVQQVQSLVTIVQDAITNLPQLIASISGKVYQWGPFKVDFSALDLKALSNQVLGMVQPLLSRTGALAWDSCRRRQPTYLAGCSLSFWFHISYLQKAAGCADSLSQWIYPAIPMTLNVSLANWVALGTPFYADRSSSSSLPLLYIPLYSACSGCITPSAWHSWQGWRALFRTLDLPSTGRCLSSFPIFKYSNCSDSPPLYYTLLVLIIALVIDQIFDNIVSPRILSDALKVHPAAVLVAAIIAANLFGLLGVVVAAPILATATLLWKYIMRKMLDLDPWPEQEIHQPPPPPGSRLLVSIRRFFRTFSLNRNKSK